MLHDSRYIHSPLHKKKATPAPTGKAPLSIADESNLPDYSAVSFRISSILMAESGMRVPGPKMAATPAL